MENPTGDETRMDLRHPAVIAIEHARQVISDLDELPLMGLNTTEAVSVVGDIEQILTRATAIEAKALQQAETIEVAAATGATSTANWLAHTHVMTRAEAHRRTRLAAGLDAHPATAEALGCAEVLPEQAPVILHALEKVEKLPADLAQLAAERTGMTISELVASAEENLLVEAKSLDAKELRILGRRILDVVCPEVGEAYEQRQLEAEEEAAAQDTRLTMSPDGHGRVRGRFTLPEATAAMFKKQLLAFAAPKHQAATALHDADPILLRRPTAQKMGAAFAEWIRRYPTDRLPNAGGVPATIVVTMSLEQLLTGLGTATLDDGTRITAGQARRMACEAGIIPIVLGGQSQPLDVGRAKRFHTPAQRIAIAARDGGCTAESCDWPPGLCHVHHDILWSHGGSTNVTDGRLLCPRHHAFAHNPNYQTTRLGNGKIRFTRRT